MNSGEDLFLSSCVKFCRKLKPNLIAGSGWDVADVVGAPIVVTPGSADVAVVGGEVVLPRN